MIDYKEYYKKSSVLFEMVKTMKGRAVALLSDKEMPVRGIKAHNISYLQNNFNAFHFFEKNYNIYNSVAIFNLMPQFSYSPSKRAEQYEFFGKNFKNYLVDFDFCFDFDGKEDFNKCSLEVTTLKQLFDKYSIPYYLKFSGSGFHFVIEGKYIESRSPMDKLKLIELYANEVNKLLNFETMDLRIYDSRRVFKTPYSLDIKTDRIALPLTDYDFNNFTLDLVEINNVVENIALINRGLLTRNGNKDNFTKFVEEIIYGN